MEVIPREELIKNLNIMYNNVENIIIDVRFLKKKTKFLYNLFVVLFGISVGMGIIFFTTIIRYI